MGSRHGATRTDCDRLAATRAPRHGFIAGVALALALAGCATGPVAPPAPVRGPGVSPASLGELLDGRRLRGERAAVAGLAPVAGSAAAYVDRIEAELRDRAATGFIVTRTGGNLDVRLPSATTFDFNAATVKTKARPALDALATVLAAYPATFVDITGHTDSVGTDQVNQRLSDERAAAIGVALINRGVARARLAMRGLGKAQPAASNADAAGRAANRRVEVHLSPILPEDVRRTRR